MEERKMESITMFYQELKKESYYIYSSEIELMMAAIHILDGGKVHNISLQIYTKAKLDALKKKYAFLTEIFHAVECPYGMLELLTDYTLKDFNIDAYSNYLLSMDTAGFLSRYFNIFNEELVRGALEKDEEFEKLYRTYSKSQGSYLGYKMFFRESKRIICDFFAFTKELDTEDFHKEIVRVDHMLAEEEKMAKKELEHLEPLEYSQKLMGKTFHNRGPYQEFYFSPSLFIMHRMVRFFGKNQVLIYSVREPQENQEKLLKQLKAIGDETRFKILTLLNAKEPLRGLDIAKELSMAPSTISHHMEQLKSCGLLNEEQDRSSKYYSISRNNGKELLETLERLLKREV